MPAILGMYMYRNYVFVGYVYRAEILMPTKRITKKMLFIKAVEIIKEWFKFQDWKITVKFAKSMKETAYCKVDPEYKIASIHVNLEHLKDLTHNEVVATALHELLHCIVWPLGEWAVRLSNKDKYKLEICRRYEEEVVTNLERVILPLIEAQLNSKLHDAGYETVDLAFTDFGINHNY
jgi:hypothetical protein